MIDLGKISIKDETSIIESRNKIRLLAEDLKFDPIGATRLATITSELTRIIYQKDEESSILVGFDKKEDTFGLILIFQSKKKDLEIKNAQNFFDKLDTSRAKDGFQIVETFKYIPDPEFEPTKEFIDAEKEKLLRLSRAELLEEVKHKNEELLKLLDELKERAKREKKLAVQAAAAEKKLAEELDKAYKQLEIKTREVEKLNQVKSDFISTVSHELRTPLSITKEGINLVLDKILGEINEKQEKILRTAKNNIDRLARIIDELLDVSKIEAGKVVLRRELVDMAGLIRQAASSFELNLKEKKIELKVNVPKKQIDAFVDPDKITQVFTNLIGNALKFTDRGYIEISLQEKEKEIACIVADTGLGISEEDLPKVFSKFEQFGRLPGPGEKGTGLGLSITKGIIELHGGKIWVESKPGAGTKFSFNLPKYTTEEIFKDYLNNGMREAMDKKTRMALIVISMTEFNKLKQEFSDEKMGAILRSMEGIIKDVLRRKGDVALKDSGEMVVILADCDKGAVLSVENRLKEALDKYLTNEKLSGEIKLRFGSAVYPDEAKNDTELIEKAKKA